MALRGIRHTSQSDSSADEKKIEQFINQGGSSFQSSGTSTDDDPVKKVQLRLYESQIKDIDQVLSQRPKRAQVSRHQWILDAIQEKLTREQS